MISPIKITLPEYKFDHEPDLNLIASQIDGVIISNFKGLKVVIRGIQSKKHEMPKADLIDLILKTGSGSYRQAADKQIDLYGADQIINRPPITLPILEGFHRWKPKSLERPQQPVDIWMIYDAKELKNVEYTHKTYGVEVADGYVFRNSDKKSRALIGLLVIDC